MSTALACPQCGDHTSLRTTERVLGYQSASVFVEPNGSAAPDIEYGSTEMLWDTSETIGWNCGACLWEGPEGVDDPFAAGLVPVTGEEES